MHDATPHTSFAGLDVAKDSLQLAILKHEKCRQHAFRSTAADVRKLVKLCAKEKVELIVLEATGGLERDVAAALAAAGVPLAIVNPRQVRDFAKSTGRLAKTDAIDAEVLALFAQRIKPPVRPLPSEEQMQLADLAARREQLITMRTAEINRLGTARSKSIKRSIERVIATLSAQIDDIDHDLDRLIASNEQWQKTADILDSAPGIGRVTACALVAQMSELGRLNRQQVAALAGLAPLNNDSGRWRGKRKIRGGRSAVRTALYMATLTAIRCNATIKRFYQRLLAAGKLKMVALTAAMRKFLTILNQMVRNRQHWTTASHA